MNASTLRGFVVAFAACAVAVVPVPANEKAPTATQPTLPPQARDPSLPDLSSTAIGAVIEANGGKVPANGVELRQALDKLGTVVQLSFPFSAVALDSGLSHPRVVLTLQMTPSTEMVPFTPPGGWTPHRKAEPKPIPNFLAEARNLEGRLFLAANMEAVGGNQLPRVKSVEFISWNTRRLKYDFGVIEGMGDSPQFKLVDGVRCFSCHKNHGPILGVAPWSNSIHNDLVRSVTESRFKSLSPSTRIDGMNLFESSAPDVDEAVRRSGSFLRNRETFRALAKTGLGRKALVKLLVELADTDNLEEIDKRIRREYQKGDLIPFVTDMVAIQKASSSGILIDFSSAKSLGKLNGNRISWGGTLDIVSQHDQLRAAGEFVIPTERQPSNPQAFVRQSVNESEHPSDHMSAVKLARALGLTEKDRTFLMTTLRSAVTALNDPKVTNVSLAKEVFNGPAFEDVLKGGAELPDRDEFKDRFVDGLIEVMNWGGKSTGWYKAGWAPPKRSTYTSSPLIDRSIRVPEVELTPTTACLRCHDVKPAGKSAVGLSPIPMLAFDPFDKQARETWIKSADRKQKGIVLARLLKRIAEDQDMPPQDSLEMRLFREKDGASFEAVQQWLEAELKKAN